MQKYIFFYESQKNNDTIYQFKIEAIKDYLNGSKVLSEQNMYLYIQRIIPYIIMYIENLSLLNFKNYADLNLEFHSKLNCFIGDNGEGKTNLLDALHYLCMCKSYFNVTDLYSIRRNEEFMVLQAQFKREKKNEELYCGLKQNNKKQFRRNKKEYARLSDHIGLFPVVMVSPVDIQLITEGSEQRRKYINGVISQYDRLYLEDTMHYRRILAQRNKFLKDTRTNSETNELLDVFDRQLVEYGISIHKKRLEFISEFIPVFNHFYQFISGGSEPVELIYQSQLNDADFSEKLKEARQRDLVLKYTTVGIHKDDLVLNLNGEPIRRIGSQGQQKTYLVSMKFAQFEFLQKLKGFPPLLLLDDVFDKLDVKRVRQILKLVNDNSFGQIFITHTNLDRMKGILNELNIDHKLYLVSDGKVNTIDDQLPESKK